MIINNNNNPLFLLLLLHFILFSSISQRPSILVEARPLSFKSHTGQSGNLALLGVVCKCCDGVDGACTSTWTQSCSNLQCSPWKYQTRPS